MFPCKVFGARTSIKAAAAQPGEGQCKKVVVKILRGLFRADQAAISLRPDETLKLATDASYLCVRAVGLMVEVKAYQAKQKMSACDAGVCCVGRLLAAHLQLIWL